MSNLESSLDRVRDKASFVAFLGALIADYESNQSTWENRTLDQLLESMQSWLEDMDLDDYYERIDSSDVMLENINWRVFADVLVSAAIYE